MQEEEGLRSVVNMRNDQRTADVAAKALLQVRGIGRLAHRSAKTARHSAPRHWRSSRSSRASDCCWIHVHPAWALPPPPHRGRQIPSTAHSLRPPRRECLPSGYFADRRATRRNPFRPGSASSNPKLQPTPLQLLAARLEPAFLKARPIRRHSHPDPRQRHSASPTAPGIRGFPRLRRLLLACHFERTRSATAGRSRDQRGDSGWRDRRSRATWP